MGGGETYSRLHILLQSLHNLLQVATSPGTNLEQPLRAHVVDREARRLLEPAAVERDGSQEQLDELFGNRPMDRRGSGRVELGWTVRQMADRVEDRFGDERGADRKSVV